tara:strand:+ start:6559 stop:6738 length:180 start_codon:yes stop_codon:yes gene_type:complete
MSWACKVILYTTANYTRSNNALNVSQHSLGRIAITVVRIHTYSNINETKRFYIDILASG